MAQKEELSKKAQSLVSLIDYQEGSIVSKMLINKKVGTITLFAFDKGQGLSEHTAPYDAFVLVVDGKLNVTIEGENHEVSSGELIIMPANKPHAVHCNERAKMLLVMIRE